MIDVRCSDEVRDTLAAGGAVVAMESTIYSNLGLPAPANGEALERCIAAVRSQGAVPAVTAVLDGEVRVGLDPSEHDRILGTARKAAERDVPVAVAQRWEFGATTVSASVAIAAAAGISVFATGGLGGVHRGAELTGDVSADLDALANHRVVSVSAGAKAFLDLPRTLEYLETAGVPVLGWQHDWFPAFYTRSSGLPVAHRVETADEVAAVFANLTRTQSGLLVTVPIPEDDELDAAELVQVLDDALAECDRNGIVGAAITPFVLDRIATATAGRSIPANLAFAENNAGVAAEIAVAIACSLSVRWCQAPTRHFLGGVPHSGLDASTRDALDLRGEVVEVGVAAVGVVGVDAVERKPVCAGQGVAHRAQAAGQCPLATFALQ